MVVSLYNWQVEISTSPQMTSCEVGEIVTKPVLIGRITQTGDFAPRAGYIEYFWRDSAG